ncbi:unnamed protein product [Effrenium voratum]|uniref:RING-type domain-containing protein n=1 Tax=Effrenium voratum TaxID=2562239 RepID=A0AA36I447_9DINO|nr:unnamed protein product [Effrenium voratum]
MDQTDVPKLDAAELRSLGAALSVKELKKQLQELQVDLRGCVEKSELVDAFAKRLEDEKTRRSLLSYCRICCDWRLEDDIWPLTCGHIVCVQCLSVHLESQMETMRSSLKYHLPCPYAPACTHEIRFQDAAAMSDALRRLWADLQKRERLLREAKYQVLECPKAGCVGVAYLEKGRRTAMCFICEHTWEADAGGQDQEWQKPGFSRHVRRCPKCQAPIEKNGGCNHMKCTQCGRDFDWAASQAADSSASNSAGAEDEFSLPQGFEGLGEAVRGFSQFTAAFTGEAKGVCATVMVGRTWDKE